MMECGELHAPHRLQSSRFSLPLAIVIAFAPWWCNAAAAGEMLTAESRHYTILSDLDRDLTVDLGRRADAMYEEYSRRLSDFAPSDSSARYEIRLFEQRSDYLKLTGDRFSNTGGIFMSGRNLL